MVTHLLLNQSQSLVCWFKAWRVCWWDAALVLSPTPASIPNPVLWSFSACWLLIASRARKGFFPLPCSEALGCWPQLRLRVLTGVCWYLQNTEEVPCWKVLLLHSGLYLPPNVKSRRNISLSLGMVSRDCAFLRRLEQDPCSKISWASMHQPLPCAVAGHGQCPGLSCTYPWHGIGCSCCS